MPMYSYEQRMKAVELYIEKDKSPAAVFNLLGYPVRSTLYEWFREFSESGNLHESRLRWSKFTEEQKLAAVKHYFESGRSLSKTKRALGYPSLALLCAWIDEIAPGMRKRSGKERVKCTEEQKFDAVVALIDERVAVIAEKTGVHMVTLHNWKRKLLGEEARDVMDNINNEELPEDIESLRAIAKDLQEDIRRHKMEVAVWQGAAELVKKDPGIDPKNLTNKEKVILIDALRNEFELKELLALLNIARSSYYYQREAITLPDKYVGLRARIKEVFDEHNGNWGYRRIWGTLRVSKDEPLIVSEKVIRRLMHEDELQVVYNRKKKRWSSYQGEISEAPKNLVDRNFHARRPNELWLTDITQFTLPNFKCFLSPIIDCFDGKVVSWSISKSPNAELANTMLKTAVKTLSEDEKPVTHSDRGGHYRWPAWIEICKEAGLVRSMSKKGCSPDNSACEGFFGRLKNEFFYHRDWSGIDYDTFSTMLSSYIVYYNDKRIKKSLGWKSPTEYRISLGLAA